MNNSKKFQNKTVDFTCENGGRYSGSHNQIELKSLKVEVLKNVTSCQFGFYTSSDYNELSFLQFKLKRSDDFTFYSICNSEKRKVEEVKGLSKELKRLLVKTHAILMLLGWLFFIPTGFLFARFGKDLFSGHKLSGMPVWFQIHRTSTFLGVSCVCCSIFCILVSTNWSWKGTGSGAWYWTQWHTDLGTISTILAVSQPLNSLLRCPLSDSRRSIFNWAHRIVGFASYTFAVAAIYVAAANYRKTWSEPFMEIVLSSVPTVLCLTTGLGVWCVERRGYQEVNQKPAHSSERVFRISWLFLVVGTCLGSSISLSLLVANGFKTG